MLTLILNSKNSYKTIRIDLFKLFSNQDIVISILHQNMSSANDLGESLWSLIHSANNSNGLFRCSGSLSLVWKIICVCV